MIYLDQTNFIFKNLFGNNPTRIHRIEEGVMNEKYKVEISGKQYLIRFYLIDGNKKVKYEPGIIKRLKNEGAKVPDIIYSSQGSEKTMEQFIIYEWIPGQSVSSFLKKNLLFDSPQFIEDVVRNLTIISNMKIDGFGELESESSAKHSSFKNFIVNKIKEGIKDLQETSFVNYYNVQRIQSFLDNFSSRNLETHVKPSLIWSDMSFDNMVIYNENLQSFVDFEYLYSGDEKMTIGYFYSRSGDLKLGAKIIDQFKSETALNANFDESLVFYSLIRFIIFSKYFNTSLPNGKSRADFFEVFPGINKSLSKFRY